MTKEDQLARAAKALVEAASTEADSMAQQRLTESLNTLKDSFQKSLSISTKSNNDLAQKFDDKINTVNQNIDKLFSEVKKLNDISAKQHVEQLRLKRLEFAHANTNLGSFQFYGKNSDVKESADLAKSIIGWFILGYGCNLPKDAYISESMYDCSDESKKAFRDNLLKQIKQLIGREPRVIGDTIYYE